MAFAAEETSNNGEVKQNCKRCHSGGPGEAELDYDFYTFVKDFPRARFGNRVDWMKAEEQGLIALEDQIEGISFPRTDFKHPEEFDIKAAVYGIPDIAASSVTPRSLASRGAAPSTTCRTYSTASSVAPVTAAWPFPTRTASSVTPKRSSEEGWPRAFR
jgi:hypothetical protein